jgi:nitrate reductase NapAB chaperone NapD
VNLSGILVVARPGRLDDALQALRELPGVDVHQHEAPTGRIVVTQEAESAGAEAEGLRRLRALPDVATAELVYHRLAEPARPPAVADAPSPPSGDRS